VAVRRAVMSLIAMTAFFLSLWIVLPAPNLFFLRLAVGAPEISPLLALVALLLLIINIWQRKNAKKREKSLFRGVIGYRLFIAMLMVTVALSSWPLLGQSTVVAQAEQSMAATISLSGSA